MLHEINSCDVAQFKLTVAAASDVNIGLKLVTCNIQTYSLVADHSIVGL